MALHTGSGYGLRLLLNIERYERVESCTPKFRTMSLPGVKILIYNQTDLPASSLDGVNVPPGYSMDIPFRIQHVGANLLLHIFLPIFPEWRWCQSPILFANNSANQI